MDVLHRIYDEIIDYDMNDQELVQRILTLTHRQSAGFQKRHSFSPNSARIWVRANFHCEYCDQLMLESIMAYSSYQYDHILPQRHYKHNPILTAHTSELFRARIFSEEELSNFALSCRLCNSVKSSFDPNAKSPIFSGQGGLAPDVRAELIKRVREKIGSVRQEHQQMFQMVRDLVATERPTALDQP